MQEDDQFLAMQDNDSQFSKRVSHQKSGVIKQDRSRLSGTIHLPVSKQNMDEGVEYFEPIYDGELIVGVTHRCHCGKISKLRFEYGNQ